MRSLLLQQHDAKIMRQRSTVKAATTISVRLKRDIARSFNPVLDPVGSVIHHQKPAQILVSLEGELTMLVRTHHGSSVQSGYSANDLYLRDRLVGLGVENCSVGRRCLQVSMGENDASR